ncbi:MAG: hypothetical protein RL095_3145 [Verrucomicrobiota bacterium]|jgi:hypothetical protein
MSQVVPYLSRCDFLGKDLMLHRDLVKHSSATRACVVYGYKDARGKLQFLSNAEAGQNGWTIGFVEKEALELLMQKSQPEWDPKIVNHNGASHQVLICEGDEMTASNILKKSMLVELQQHFGGDAIYLAVPNRNTIIAAGSAEAIIELVRSKWDMSETRGYVKVSDMIYAAKNGKVLGAATLPPAPLAPKLTVKAPAPAAAPAAPSAPAAPGKMQLKLPGKRQAAPEPEEEEAPAPRRGLAAKPAAPAAPGKMQLKLPGKRQAAPEPEEEEEEAPAPRRASNVPRLSLKPKR